MNDKGGRKKPSPGDKGTRGQQHSESQNTQHNSADPVVEKHGLPADDDFAGMLQALKPHDHLCLIYSSQAEWRAAAVPFIANGLNRGEKCLYVVDTSTADDIRSFLREEGVDVASHERSGQLFILHESETYTREGFFDPDRMISLLKAETKKAVTEGYPALRVTGEMTWALRGYPGAEKLLEYEAKLNRDFFPFFSCLAICQYDRRKFDPEVIKGIIMTHPVLIFGNHIYRNFYYIPTGEFLKQKRADLEVQCWLNNLQREQRITEMLRESELRYRRLFETAQDAILILDGETGQIIDANPFIVNILGYSKEELLGKNLWEIGLFKDRQMSKSAYKKLQKEGYIRYEHLPLQTKTGTPVAVEFVSNKYEVAGKKIIQCNIRDITEQKKIEEEKKKLEQRVQVINRVSAVGEMAAGIAHEINNPLTGVIGFSQLLMKRDIPEDIREEIVTIYESAQRIASIVNRLLTFSHQIKPERKLTAINELINNTIELRAYHLRTNNIEVVTDLASDLPLIMIDPGQLQQVFLNIIVNAEIAIKQIRNKGILSIKTEKLSDNVRIYFEDNGQGISRENMKKIFNPFFTTRQVGQGTGLGLSICYGIVADHNGRLWAESTPGKGATFIVELPLVTKNQRVKSVIPVDDISLKARRQNTGSRR